MANELQHISLANRNHEALQHLISDKDRFPEWIATVAFYKAVQIVEAVLYTSLGHHSTSHRERLIALKMARFQPIFKAYRPLVTASRIARYLEDCGDRDLDGKTVINAPKGSFKQFAPDYMTCDEVVSELVEKRLRQCEDHTRGFLTDEGRELLKRI